VILSVLAPAEQGCKFANGEKALMTSDYRSTVDDGSRKSAMHNSFLDALHSEIVAGSENLTAWVRQVQTQGAIDSLFGLETWLKGIRAFFDIEHLPLSETERNGLLSRSFGAEIGIVRQSLQRCEIYACDVMNPSIGEKFEFEDFFEAQMRRDRLLDYNISRIAEQLTPADSVSQLSESLNDLRVLIDSLHMQAERNFQLFLTLGRSFTREIRNCRYIDMLMSQRFRIQYDLVDNKALTGALRRVPEELVRRNIALVFLYLFRFLKYLKLVQADLNRDRPLKRHLVLFSLLHEEMGSLSDFLRSRLLRNREVGNALQNAAELISYSIKMESERVQARELVMVAQEADPGIVFSRIENSHGLLRNCCETSIITLIQSIDKSFDPTILFPSRAGELLQAEKLRQDLWALRRWLMDVLGNREELDTSRIIERINEFRDASMRSLMYRDWAEFEAFSDALAVSIKYLEIRTHIRKFVSYLETLIQEVSKRSVFRENQS
jgi:hypothetical protein